MSYLIMECHPGYVVVLDEEGRFLKAANLQYEIGQTVYNPVLMKDAPEKKRHTVWWIGSSIAAVAACFLLFFGNHYYQNYLQTYSSIYLTINPEVQIDLNRQGKVVMLTGMNEDGKTLLEGYDGNGKDKVTVSDELIDRAIGMGFLSEGGQVSFSIDSPDDALFQEYGIELRTGVTEYLEGRITVTIEIVNHKDREQQENRESQESQEKQESSPDQGSPQPQDVSPAPSGSAGYDDTDYGENSDGVTNYIPPSADTDYDSGYGDDGGSDNDDGEDDD